MKRLLVRTLKVLGWSVATTLLTLVSMFVYYDLREFQSRKPAILQLIADASPAERSPAPALRELLLTDDPDMLAFHVARLVLTDLDVPWVTHGNLGWNATHALWDALIRMHLSEDQQVAIILARSSVVPGTLGFESAANRVFQLPLVQLHEEQLATLVVMRRSPARWAEPENRTGLMEARDALIRRARQNEARR